VRWDARWAARDVGVEIGHPTQLPIFCLVGRHRMYAVLKITTAPHAQGLHFSNVLNYDERFSYPDLYPGLSLKRWCSTLHRGVSPTSSYNLSGKSSNETMMYQISYGPPGSRMVESTENIDLAADRYFELARENAPKIELYVEGMPLDPRKLLSASPDRKYLRSIVFAPR